MENCGKLWKTSLAARYGVRGPRFDAPGATTALGVTALQACSACAGDYEDPERTAWPVDEPAMDQSAVDEVDADKIAPSEGSNCAMDDR